MDRHYTLPLAFAAAFHAALLFGFSKSPRAMPLTQPIDRPVPFELPKPPEDPPLVEAASTEAPAARTAIEPPPVRGAEQVALPISADDFITRTPPPLPGIGTNTKITLDTIPGITGGTGFSGDIFSVGLLDKSPQTRFQPAPLYPFEAKREGLRGEVVVEFIVDEQGRVHDPRVVSSTSRVFEEPTLRAVSKWIFEPGKRSGRAVRFRMAVPVQFNLND